MTKLSRYAFGIAFDAFVRGNMHGHEIGLSDADRDKTGVEFASAAIIRECAKIAANACLVPPDGGSPTEQERLVCEEASRSILALLVPDGESK